MTCPSSDNRRIFFFFNDTATTEIYTVYNTLSLHDALPIYGAHHRAVRPRRLRLAGPRHRSEEHTSELQSLYTISYAVFCLKKKNLNFSRLRTTRIPASQRVTVGAYTR